MGRLIKPGVSPLIEMQTFRLIEASNISLN